MPVYFNGRLTTEETVIKYRYGIGGGYVDASHVSAVVVPAGLSAGEYRIRINGWETGAIDVAAANQVVAQQAAIDAIVDYDGTVVFASGDLVVSGTDPNMVWTFAQAWANIPIILEVFQATGDTAMTGGALTDITVATTTQGGGYITLSDHAMNINTGETQEAVDVTAMGEVVRNESTTVAAGTFDMRIFHAQQSFLALLRKGSTGRLTVYEQGIGNGRPYFSQQILLKQQDVSREAFDKIEISLSGSFQGAPFVPFGSNQPSA